MKFVESCRKASQKSRCLKSMARYESRRGYKVLLVVKQTEKELNLARIDGQLRKYQNGDAVVVVKRAPKRIRRRLKQLQRAGANDGDIE